MPEEVTLRDKYCNAVVTHYGCGGHGKAARNEEMMAHWKKELETRNEAVPEIKDALKIGVFNGEGAV